MAARNSVSSIFVTGISGILLAASVSEAAFGTPSWTRPTTVGQATTDGTTHQQWNFFSDDDINTTSIEDGVPDVANTNPNGNATVFEPGNGFVTGGGNIYSPTGILNLTFNIPTTDIGGGVTKFLLQIKTLGSELVYSNHPNTPIVNDFSQFTIDGIAISTLPDFSYAELSRVALGGMGGNGVEHAFTFTLPSTAASHVLNYKPLFSSTSQDIVSIDTQVSLPEPASMGLLGLGAIALIRRRSK